MATTVLNLVTTELREAISSKIDSLADKYDSLADKYEPWVISLYVLVCFIAFLSIINNILLGIVVVRRQRN